MMTIKVFILVFLFSLTTVTYSQTVINMADMERPQGYIKNGTYYIKDVNNHFSPFLGTWQYIEGDTEFRIIISKVTKFHVNLPQYNINYYEDALRIRYKKYQAGNLIYSSPEDEFPSGVSKKFGEVRMSFTDYQRNAELFPLVLILTAVAGSGHTTVGSYKLYFKLENHERTNSYYAQHPDEPYFSVPNKIEMIKMTGLIIED